MFSRNVYIPNGAVMVADTASDAIAYAYDTASGKPCAMVFYGKQSKPVHHCSYRDDERRAVDVAAWFDARQKHCAYVAAARKSPSGTATRNRAIKAILEGAYGKGLVRVTGATGTAHGWVHVKIAIPRPTGEAYHDTRADVMRLIDAAGIQIGRYDSGDYGAGREITIDFTG